MKRSPIKKRLNTLIVVCCVPFAMLALYLIFMLAHFSEKYNVIVKNITKVNSFNTKFKEDIDYSMYIIIVNSERAPELINTKEPYEEINKMRTVFKELEKNADKKEAENLLSRIVTCLDLLEDRVDEIVEDAKVSGNYDVNIERLDVNIRILTQLIQEQLQDYIYYEATSLEIVRAELMQDITHAIQMTLIIFIMILVGAIIVARTLKKRITDPVQELVNTSQKVSKGDMNVRAMYEFSDPEDELAELMHSFNQMLDQIGQLVEDVKEEQTNLQATELKLFQAQINPHFLYNTLDTIVWLAETNEKGQVIAMVTALSDFYRISLSKGRDYITIKEDEAHIRSYLQIQQFRYRDILEYDIDFDPEIYSYEILKLTLQPLVENALYHGLKNKRGKGHIQILGYKTEDGIEFCVADNGVGMKPERLDAIIKQLSGDLRKDEGVDHSSSSGFGLYNVAQRLWLNYGKNYGLRIESEYGEGTVVYLKIPYGNP